MVLETVPTLDICYTADECCVFIEDYSEQIKLMITTNIGTEYEFTHELKFDLLQDTPFTSTKDLMAHLRTMNAIDIINLYYSDEVEEA